MGYHRFIDLRELEYILARLRIDELCESIRRRHVTSDQARDEYRKIENRFLSSNHEKAELFRMIYKSRIERLCGQFLMGGA
jgi:hypothetical protein